MGKKKAAAIEKPFTVRLPSGIYRKFIKRAEAETGGNLSGMAAQLIRQALDAEQPVTSDELTHQLTHFEEQVAEQISTLNYNLRQATGMILIPKPKTKKQPQEKFRIDSPQEAASWVKSKFRELPD